MRIPQLTFTRFIAAFLIVAYHFGKIVYPFSIPVLKPLVENLNVLVSYFFILSGFVLAVSTFKSMSEGKTIQFKSFIKPRLARLYPMFLFALVLFFIFGQKLHFSWIDIVLNLSLLQAWIPPYPLSLNSPAWAISVEILFYISFPFLINKLFNKKSDTLIWLAVTSWLCNTLLLYLNIEIFKAGRDFMFFFPPFHLLTFIVGVCSGLLFMRHHQQLQKYISYMTVSAFLAIGFSIYLFISKQPIITYQHNGLFAPTFLLFIYWFSLSKSFIVKIFSLRFFQYLGELSYAIYILQVPVFFFFLHIMHPYFHFETNTGFIVYFSVLLLSSVIAFEVIEKPCKNLILKIAES
jgi:peptidoglycan/LPS O-acetylase OafA/YrhL